MRPKKGFTIIEVVLVLAIAGLIFAMVFIGIPNLMKGYRDTERKRNLSLISEAVDRFIMENGVSDNNFDTMSLVFAYTYIPEIKDPSTGDIEIVLKDKKGLERGDILNEADIINGLLKQTEIGDVSVYYHAQCTGNTTPIVYSEAKNNYVVVTPLEQSQTYYCLDNS